MSLFVCGKANGVDVHVQSQFLLISKLALDELKAVQKASIQVLEMCSGDPDVMLGASIPQVQPPATQDYSKDSENYLRILPDMADAEALFQERWKRGEAVVYQGGVEGISEVWSPRCFIENHGHDSARVVDCVTKNETRMQVGNFFRYFLDNTLTRSQILKLPDWPDHTDFDKKFPRHFKDFKTKVPFEKYSGFVGSRNLAARLPFHFLPPDLGPKMYNAFGSSDAGEDGYGTTPIHLDMADAVNVMMYASTLKPEDEHRPAAVWDIYSRNDSEKIREYLREYHASSTSSKLVIDDPVHDQFFYLNEAMRQELFEKKGVVGWRIFQNPGDAVFVPAGSCHQVCNYKDCVKAACDFVSPENLSACLQLTSEFRTLSKTHRRREDLLNLKSILWNVWTSCPLLTLSKETEVVEKAPQSLQDLTLTLNPNPMIVLQNPPPGRTAQQPQQRLSLLQTISILSSRNASTSTTNSSTKTASISVRDVVSAYLQDSLSLSLSLDDKLSVGIPSHWIHNFELAMMRPRRPVQYECMFSYSTDHATTAMRVFEALVDRGYVAKLEIGQHNNNIDEPDEQALHLVLDSKVIIACISKGYVDNQRCKKELVFAHSQHAFGKRIIKVILDDIEETAWVNDIVSNSDTIHIREKELNDVNSWNDAIELLCLEIDNAAQDIARSTSLQYPVANEGDAYFYWSQITPDGVIAESPSAFFPDNTLIGNESPGVFADRNVKFAGSLDSIETENLFITASHKPLGRDEVQIANEYRQSQSQKHPLSNDTPTGPAINTYPVSSKALNDQLSNVETTVSASGVDHMHAITALEGTIMQQQTEIESLKTHVAELQGTVEKQTMMLKRLFEFLGVKG
ncbi:hypothetical protein HDU99_003467 [Rhizoclosmatium hyalinum]|nr:hypothetical protein HDU99_003467 [Rhizoclosmatium hyalinum]